jgi:chromate reductase, NAD(P)H dehydrogenase (quinone)
VTSGRSRDCVSPTGSVNRLRNWIGNRATWSIPHGESLAAGKFVPVMDAEPRVDRTIRVLLVSGSLRGRSTNTAALRTAAALVVPGVEGVLYEGVGGLPHFNPDDDSDPLPDAVADLRSRIRTADAVVLSAPEYAGALPGSFKNLLDWTIGDDHPGSIYRKPVAWVNVSAHGAVDAHESLRKILRYANAEVIEEACTEVSVTHPMVDDAGLIADERVRSHLAVLLEVLAAHLRSIDDAARSSEQRPKRLHLQWKS